jgi:16S rRNA C967 or C1407 C5-methylase (RsmB/RsmF family)
MITTLPQWLQDMIRSIHSSEELAIVEAGLNTAQRLPTFRINTIKADAIETIDSLTDQGLEIEKIDFLENAYMLKTGREKDLWDTGAFKSGYIYMQSLSSMIPVACMGLEKINQSNGVLVLDAAAAPWSKTSQMAAQLNNGGKIIAVDNNAIRIDKLNFTLKRQGVKNTTVIKSDARTLLAKLGESEVGNFDAILADVPCSSEGRISTQNEKSYSLWEEKTNKRSYKLQKQILQSIVPLLKDGWELMYSTCTISPEENEAVVHFILCNYPELTIVDIAQEYETIFAGLPTKPGLKEFGTTVYKSEVTQSIRILPSLQTQGFFIAKFRKKA